VPSATLAVSLPNTTVSLPLPSEIVIAPFPVQQVSSPLPPVAVVVPAGPREVASPVPSIINILLSIAALPPMTSPSEPPCSVLLPLPAHMLTGPARTVRVLPFDSESLVEGAPTDHDRLAG
jgi:hypothetical protein